MKTTATVPVHEMIPKTDGEDAYVPRHAAPAEMPTGIISKTSVDTPAARIAQS